MISLGKIILCFAKFMKTIGALIVLFLMTLSCNDTTNSASKNESIRFEKDSLKAKEIKPRPTVELIYEKENLKLFGDSTLQSGKFSHASIKFQPYIGFDDFKVAAIDHKKYAELNLKSNANANNFRTRLKEGYSCDTANFAGHYSFVYWGCGSPCQSSLLIDRRSGKIYDSPSASLGYEFRVDSRMLIVNPPDSSGLYDDCSYCKPIIYIFEDQKKTFTEIKNK